MRLSKIAAAICLLGILHIVFPETTSWTSQANPALRETIRGRVLDKDSRDPLPGVSITIDGTSFGTSTDSNGNFVLANLLPGMYSLTITMIGYEAVHLRDLTFGNNALLDIGDIELSPTTLLLNEIVVTPGRFSIMGAAQASHQVLSSEEIKYMSWSEDITRAIARLPGISSSDFSSKFTIRGGETDEVLITLDGMELYEPFHQRDFSGGLFSIVDIETVEGVELMTGGYSAEFGNRISGVFNMRTKSVPDGQRHTSLGLSILTARLYTDASFAKGKGSYVLSARRGMLDVLFDAIPGAETATIDQGSTPKFYDAMGKIEYELSPNYRIAFHTLHAGDNTRVRDITGENFDRNDTRYGSTYSWITLNASHSSHLFSRSLLYGGYITHNRNGSFNKYEDIDKGIFNLKDKRNYTFIGLKQDWNWDSGSNMLLAAGFEAKQLNANYDYFSSLRELRINAAEELYIYDHTTDIETSPSGQQLSLYASSRFKLLPKLVAEAGLRYDKTTYSNDDLVSPRVGLAYAFSERTILRGAWGYFYQSPFINDLDVNHGSTTFNSAERSTHYVVGLEHHLSNGIELRIDGYIKDLSRYNPSWRNLRDSAEMFPEARNDNARLIRSGAESNGIELFAKRDQGGKFSWWLSYSLAKAEDHVTAIQFDGLLTAHTGSISRPNNQRHTIYADLNYRPNNKWYFNLSWTYYEGWPRTDYTFRYTKIENLCPSPTFNCNPDDLYFYPVHLDFNATEYPPFHRMDLRINRPFVMKGSRLITYLHLINLYNRQNLKKWDLDARNDADELSLDEQGNYVPIHDDKYWFGFIPVLGLSWEF